MIWQAIVLTARYGVALRSEAAVSALGIWLIERTDEYGYDEYDSAVVYAETG